jgi:hypothetical protein
VICGPYFGAAGGVAQAVPVNWSTWLPSATQTRAEAYAHYWRHDVEKHRPAPLTG